MFFLSYASTSVACLVFILRCQASWSPGDCHTYRQQVFMWPCMRAEGGELSRWQEAALLTYLFPLIQEQKSFPEVPLPYISLGRRGSHGLSELQKWLEKEGSRFFSIHIRRWARRKDEESPTKVLVATNKLLFFLCLLLRLQTAVSANSLPHSWKWTLTNLPPRQLTLPIEHGRMGFRTLLHYFWKVISSCTWVDGTGPFKSLWSLPVQAEALRGKVVLALIRFS